MKLKYTYIILYFLIVSSIINCLIIDKRKRNNNDYEDLSRNKTFGRSNAKSKLKYHIKYKSRINKKKIKTKILYNNFINKNNITNKHLTKNNNEKNNYKSSNNKIPAKMDIPSPSLFNKNIQIMNYKSRIFSPYVDISQYPTFNLVETMNLLNINTFIISFIVCCDSPSCTTNSASFAGSIDINEKLENENQYHSIENIDKAINEFKSQNGNIILSFGGAYNKELALCHNDPHSLAKEYKKVILKYRPIRIDFDIEGNHIYDESHHKLRAEALNILKEELQEDMPLISLCLPVNPDIGFDSSTLSIIKTMKNKNVDIDLISIMTMDYGSNYLKFDSYLNALNSLELSYKQSKMIYPNIKMGVIPMIGENDDGSVFSLNDANILINKLKTKDYVYMISMWSINRDKNEGKFLSLYSNTYQNPDHEQKCGGRTKYAYSKILQNFLD